MGVKVSRNAIISSCNTNPTLQTINSNKWCAINQRLDVEEFE